MKYAHLIASVYGRPWCITAEAGRAISAQLSAWLGGKLSGIPTPKAYWEPDEDEDEDASAQTTGLPYTLNGSTAIIPVSGIIGKRMSAFESECGGCDLNTVESALNHAVSNSAVSNIVLDFDTPGGTVTGVLEAANAIAKAGESKPVYGWCETQCCSAGYWLASQCKAFVTTETAIVGSIGVYTAVMDDSEAWANEGLKQNLMKAGDFKATGMPGIPFSDTDRKRLQAEVNQIYGLFTASVIKGRGKVSADTMQGQTFMGMDSVGLNLTDGVASNMAEFLSAITTQPN